MNLARLQSAFQAGVFEDYPAVLRSIEDGPRQDRVARFRIYFDSYRLRLAEILSNDYSVLRDWLGDEEFGAIVEDYIGAARSHSPLAQDFGKALPDFLRASERWRGDALLADFASFERQLSIAFDAGDAAPLALSTLAEIGAEDWPRLVLAFHPSAIPLAVAQGVAAAYADARAGAGRTDVSPKTPENAETILFWRKEESVFYRALGPLEAAALAAGMEGRALADICARLAEEAGATEVAGSLLARWFADGLVCGLSTSPQPDQTQP